MSPGEQHVEHLAQTVADLRHRLCWLILRDCAGRQHHGKWWRWPIDCRREIRRVSQELAGAEVELREAREMLK